MHIYPLSHPPLFGTVFVAEVEAGPYTWNPCLKHWRFATSLETCVKNRRKACTAAGNLHHLCTGSFSFKHSLERAFYNYVYILCPLSSDRKLEQLNFQHSFPEVKPHCIPEDAGFGFFFSPFFFPFLETQQALEWGGKLNDPAKSSQQS